MSIAHVGPPNQRSFEGSAELVPYPGYAHEAAGYGISGRRHAGGTQDALWPSNVADQGPVADPVLLRRLGRLYIVADGVTHCADGAEASHLAVGAIAGAYYGAPYPDTTLDITARRARLLAALTTAHATLRRWPGDLYCAYYFKHSDNQVRYWPAVQAEQRNGAPHCPECGELLRGLLTTALAAVIAPDGLLLAAVGDSPTFRLSPQPGQPPEWLYGDTGEGQFLGSPLLDPARSIVIAQRQVYNGDAIVMVTDGFYDNLSGRHPQDWSDALRALAGPDAPARTRALVRRLHAWGEEQRDAKFEDDQTLLTIFVTPETVTAADEPPTLDSAPPPLDTLETGAPEIPYEQAVQRLERAGRLRDPDVAGELRLYRPAWAAAYAAAGELSQFAGDSNLKQGEVARRLEILAAPADLFAGSPTFRRLVADFISRLEDGLSAVNRAPNTAAALNKVKRLVANELAADDILRLSLDDIPLELPTVENAHPDWPRSAPAARAGAPGHRPTSSPPDHLVAEAARLVYRGNATADRLEQAAELIDQARRQGLTTVSASVWQESNWGGRPRHWPVQDLHAILRAAAVALRGQEAAHAFAPADEHAAEAGQLRRELARWCVDNQPKPEYRRVLRPALWDNYGDVLALATARDVAGRGVAGRSVVDALVHLGDNPRLATARSVYRRAFADALATDVAGLPRPIDEVDRLVEQWTVTLNDAEWRGALDKQQLLDLRLMVDFLHQNRQQTDPVTLGFQAYAALGDRSTAQRAVTDLARKACIEGQRVLQERGRLYADPPPLPRPPATPAGHALAALWELKEAYRRDDLAEMVRAVEALPEDDGFFIYKQSMRAELQRRQSTETPRPRATTSPAPTPSASPRSVMLAEMLNVPDIDLSRREQGWLQVVVIILLLLGVLVALWLLSGDAPTQNGLPATTLPLQFQVSPQVSADAVIQLGATSVTAAQAGQLLGSSTPSDANSIASVVPTTTAAPTPNARVAVPTTTAPPTIDAHWPVLLDRNPPPAISAAAQATPAPPYLYAFTGWVKAEKQTGETVWVLTSADGGPRLLLDLTQIDAGVGDALQTADRQDLPLWLLVQSATIDVTLARCRLADTACSLRQTLPEEFEASPRVIRHLVVDGPGQTRLALLMPDPQPTADGSLSGWVYGATGAYNLLPALSQDAANDVATVGGDYVVLSAAWAFDSDSNADRLIADTDHYYSLTTASQFDYVEALWSPE